ncbi:MAG TPA: hypothetical protein VFG42_04505 [Baekduia sp.]|uniref:hypothetical protein n=1 Tax=Baekduia sp. TaxID=2600305 RepID=UPI002D768436|nr:hypothetical protein [Baekduia sp.]HET6506027.1 hypothetical protein [Baekduia sp.]
MSDLALLTEHLRLARKAGMTFDIAWPVACEALLPTLPRDDRLRWGEALDSTRGERRQAYHRTGRGVALTTALPS